jgi:hypothetical protein
LAPIQITTALIRIAAIRTRTTHTTHGLPPGDFNGNKTLHDSRSPSHPPTQTMIVAAALVLLHLDQNRTT